jgi:hypothetical protein
MGTHNVQWPAIKTSHHVSVTSTFKCVLSAIMTLTADLKKNDYRSEIKIK